MVSVVTFCAKFGNTVAIVASEAANFFLRERARESQMPPFLFFYGRPINGDSRSTEYTWTRLPLSRNWLSFWIRIKNEIVSETMTTSSDGLLKSKTWLKLVLCTTRSSLASFNLKEGLIATTVAVSIVQCFSHQNWMGLNDYKALVSTVHALRSDAVI